VAQEKAKVLILILILILILRLLLRLRLFLRLLLLLLFSFFFYPWRLLQDESQDPFELLGFLANRMGFLSLLLPSLFITVVNGIMEDSLPTPHVNLQALLFGFH